jgi:hypothetical protein
MHKDFFSRKSEFDLLLTKLADTHPKLQENMAKIKFKKTQDGMLCDFSETNLHKYVQDEVEELARFCFGNP